MMLYVVKDKFGYNLLELYSTNFKKFFFFPTAALLMHKYNAHGATDVTGFGLLGHAQNLAKHQKNEVSFVIHNLPIIAKMASVAKACGNMFHLLQVRTRLTTQFSRLSRKSGCCCLVLVVSSRSCFVYGDFCLICRPSFLISAARKLTGGNKNTNWERKNAMTGHNHITTQSTTGMPVTNTTLLKSTKKPTS